MNEASLVKALARVGYPSSDGNVPLASELRPEQRALVEQMTRELWQSPPDFAIPFATWNRRRWLGLDPPGALEEEWQGAPAWREFVQFGFAGDRMLAAHLEAFPLARRLRLFVELCCRPYRLAAGMGLSWTDLTVTGADASLASTAAELADFLLEVERSDALGNGNGIADGAATPLFLILSSSPHVAFEPRWQELLPVRDLWLRGKRDLLTTCVTRLRDEDRGRVLARKLGGFLDSWVKDIVRHLLKTCRDPLLVDRAVALGVIKARKGATQASLVCRRVAGPPDARQLVALQQALQRAVPAAEVEVFALDGPDGTHRYDAVLHAGDDGLIFVTGTTDVIASMAQGGVDEIDDAALEKAIDAAFDARPKKPARTTAGRAAAKAPAKPAAKKAAAKAPAKPKRIP